MPDIQIKAASTEIDFDATQGLFGSMRDRFPSILLIKTSKAR